MFDKTWMASVLIFDCSLILRRVQKKLYVCSTGRFKVKTFLLGAVAHVRSLCSTSLKKIDSQQIFTPHCHILQIRIFFLTLSKICD